MLLQKLFKQEASLTSKISILVTVTVLLLISMLGLYFDSQLEASFLDSTQKRMQHAYKRLAHNLHNIEEDLLRGVNFIKSDHKMIAAIELINNYQDKNDYNTYLLDEEKKLIAGELLSRVKLTNSNDLAIYDKNDDLVSLSVKNGDKHKSYYVSYSGGERGIYSLTEGGGEYAKDNLIPNNIKQTHIPYYTKEEVFNKGKITYQKFNEKLFIKSHQNLIDRETGKEIAHIEMTRILDKDFFKFLSDDLDVDISISFKPGFNERSSPINNETLSSPVVVHQSDSEYISVLHRDTQHGQVYFVSRLNKKSHNAVLNSNRWNFILILIAIAAITLLVTRYLIKGGLSLPLSILMNQINRIEKQDYSAGNSLSTGDELEAISNSVNQLAITIKEREASLEISYSELQYLSSHDPLTELPNRRFFEDRLAHAIELARREGQRLALFFLDIDQFKLVNDTLGHDVGDELLVQVADRLRKHIRSADTLARIGGDEFNIMIESANNIHELEVIVKKYLEIFNKPFYCRDNEIHTTVSIGVSIYPEDGQDGVTLTKHADLAMYKSKEKGRNSFSFYSRELSYLIQERTDMINALKKAIKSGDQFKVYYQPKISVPSGQIEAVEALVRWNSPEYGFVEPDNFISLAEETGLIVQIGEWVLETACRDYMQLKSEGISLTHISINFSNVQLRDENIISEVNNAIVKTGINPYELELEITESYIATDISNAFKTMIKLCEMGVRLAIDDFGTGYSSMNYLQKLPVDRVKIDKCFIDGLPHNQGNEAITRAIIRLANSFDMDITAEGVEHQEQFEFLRKEGCDEVQGYFFSEPLPLNELIEFYSQQSKPYLGQVNE